MSIGCVIRNNNNSKNIKMLHDCKEVLLWIYIHYSAKHADPSVLIRFVLERIEKNTCKLVIGMRIPINEFSFYWFKIHCPAIESGLIIHFLVG